ncbi:NADH-dependent [FeFe] hydrogenase, group A6 [Opitutus terrae]|uniref:Hydrogenase, Fe-only n=1 Tax=Opitutus terrae (strain DSM 11246 / JCM 15787 / PB90-1) TaxID=452637 RepID=B1ZTP2_OPITP|nr:NADH-dependent [FeFe] hydrogenase, group A6 [Opitutus terrae]ACB74828.1 hydrogenase, Fe-only [Opitutus terrae PB90-1]
MIKARINQLDVEVPEGTSILDAARQVHVKIPTLCKHRDLLPTAACGICIVRNKGGNKLIRACCTPLEEGMEITTHDSDIVDVRRATLELILSNHPQACLTCGRNGECELQTLAADFNISMETIKRYVKDVPPDRSTNCIVLDFTKCIKCGRCIQVCQEMQNVWALSFLDRGINTRMAPAGDITLAESPCVKCGQCSAHCPTGAIVEKDETATVWSALRDEDKICVVQIAPSVRVTVGEAFGLPPGTNLTKKLYSALRRLGFKAVFDTNFAADVTIVEEASEFVERFAHKRGPLPLITSCCPSWTDHMEKRHYDFIDNFSTAKSPQQMLGVLAKTYYAQKAGVDPSKLFMVSIMPCTAKKYELSRTEEMHASGFADVDVVLTTRELARMLKQSGIEFLALPDAEPDSILGSYSGAGTIFGATGGVMEAAVRTAYHYATGKKLKNVELTAVRGLAGVKEGEIDINGAKVRVAVAHGLANVEQVLERVREARKAGKETPYHFIEVMACPGGCIGGGGQPYGVDNERRMKRIAGLYQDDRDRTVRYSHENPEVVQVYRDFLGKPLSGKAHELLHTRYTARPLYKR